MAEIWQMGRVRPIEKFIFCPPQTNPADKSPLPSSPNCCPEENPIDRMSHFLSTLLFVPRQEKPSEQLLRQKATVANAGNRIWQIRNSFWNGEQGRSRLEWSLRTCARYIVSR